MKQAVNEIQIGIDGLDSRAVIRDGFAQVKEAAAQHECPGVVAENQTVEFRPDGEVVVRSQTRAAGEHQRVPVFRDLVQHPVSSRGQIIIGPAAIPDLWRHRQHVRTGSARARHDEGGNVHRVIQQVTVGRRENRVGASGNRASATGVNVATRLDQFIRVASIFVERIVHAGIVIVLGKNLGVHARQRGVGVVRAIPIIVVVVQPPVAGGCLTLVAARGKPVMM